MRIQPSLITRDIKSLIERDVIELDEKSMISQEKSIISRDVNPGL